MVGDMALSFSEGANELSHFSVFSVSCYMLLVMSVSIYIGQVGWDEGSAHLELDACYYDILFPRTIFVSISI